MSSDKARRTSSRLAESHRSTPPAAKTPQIRVDRSSVQVDESELTAALQSLNLDSRQLPSRATSRAGSGSRSPALGSSNIKAGKGSDKVEEELDRFKTHVKSEFASKSEQIQFLCKITEYVIEQCSSLMEENQENMMVTTTRQVEISAGMGRSGTKIIPFSRFTRNHYARLKIAQAICVPIERLTAEVDKFLDNPSIPQMDAAAGTKSTNIEDVVGPGKVFEAFWEGEETEPKVNMKVRVGGQKHKLREDIEHAWAATTGERMITKSLVVPELRISRNSEGPEFVKVRVGDQETILTGYTDYALIHAPIGVKRLDAMSTNLESLPDEEFQNLSRLQSIVGQEAEKLGILFIEAKKFQVDGQNLWNAEPQAVAQSIAAF
ncbi:hypothetical protein AGABI1DRAFT_95025 [Agaricus bisporus var. burnettii JB137-S8]|uniref:Uncharacterized protein n=1 Tax=Agaricus bisporus var. burnettii (strain JB137-S8 / ATCC MYA-4627 / FGSC 10392) TaxID=597362 RepID=K5WWU2_AGABU|nr:uncharacterized protein AGABI1DRAFT_95025 [Agaricus bisporus var. burnettii JB137-S8]EKM75273.1 hypothetical protein AGABI1DRAFT_95025 [Agaricus bisporus var. burnettii JB137-S8]